MVSDEGTLFHSSLSIRLSFPFLQRWWCSSPRSPPRSLRACEHSCRGDEEMSSSGCVRTPLLLPSLPSSSLAFLPSPCFSQSWWSVFQARSALSSISVWRGKEEKDRVRWRRTAVDGCVAGEGWMPLDTQVNCLWGRGLTQSRRCVYMPPFTAISMCWMLLLSNITVLFSA